MREMDELKIGSARNVLIIILFSKLYNKRICRDYARESFYLRVSILYIGDVRRNLDSTKNVNCMSSIFEFPALLFIRNSGR